MTQTTLETASARGAATEKFVYFLRQWTGRGQRHHEGRARRQGRRAARDDQRRRARAPGFTIVTGVCRWYHANGRALPPGFDAQQAEALGRLEQMMDRRLGDARDPLLVSVRSGAKFSMPGMMDTVLNLGLNDGSVGGLAQRTGNPRFAWDCYRRFIQMFGSVVMGLDKPSSSS